MNDWINHPAMKNIDPVKLELIKTASKQTQGKSGKSLAPRDDGADYQRQQKTASVLPLTRCP